MTHAQRKQQMLLSSLLLSSLPLLISVSFFLSLFPVSLDSFFSYSVFSLLSSFHLLISFFKILSYIIPTCIISVCLSLFYFVLLFSFFSSFIFPAFSFVLFPTIFLCVSALMEECFSSYFIFSTIFSFFDASLKTIYVFFFLFSFVFFPPPFWPQSYLILCSFPSAVFNHRIISFPA